jgi:hypothetical protein
MPGKPIAFLESSLLPKSGLFLGSRSNGSWKDVKLTAAYRQPSDQLAKIWSPFKRKKAAEETQAGVSEIWLPWPAADRLNCLRRRRQCVRNCPHLCSYNKAETQLALIPRHEVSLSAVVISVELGPRERFSPYSQRLETYAAIAVKKVCQ